MRFTLGFLFVILFAACTDPGEQWKDPMSAQEVAPLPDPNDKGEKQGVEYWPNGVIKAEGNMKDGKRHGLWTGYNDKGKVKSRGEFINGVQQGPTVVFHDNGTIFYNGTYKDGKQVGIWKFYDNEGNEMKLIDFDKEQQEEG